MFFHECKQKGWPFSLIFIDSHSASIYLTSSPRDFWDTKHIYTPENWIRIHGKNGTHRIILAVYKDNNICRTKSWLRTKFARLRLHHTFWTLDRHLTWTTVLRMRQRSYYAGWRKNQGTGHLGYLNCTPSKIFWRPTWTDNYKYIKQESYIEAVFQK